MRTACIAGLNARSRCQANPTLIGVAILSDLVHRPWSLEGKRIETVTISDPVTPMSVGLAWHRERAFSPAMQALRNYFHDAFLAPQQLSARR